jgi:hypothetical protein
MCLYYTVPYILPVIVPACIIQCGRYARYRYAHQPPGAGPCLSSRILCAVMFGPVALSGCCIAGNALLVNAICAIHSPTVLLPPLCCHIYTYIYIYIYQPRSFKFKGAPGDAWDLRRRTEIIPVKDSHTRIKPLALASGHDRYITVTSERTIVSVGEWPLHKAVINL